jgi:hypothetical protein
MDLIAQFVMSHQTECALFGFWLGSNFVSTLPSPNGTSSKFYQWFFGFAHALAGSLPRVVPSLRIANPVTADKPYYKPPGSGV